MTEASKKRKVVIEKIPCIYYPLHFRKNTNKVQALINSGSKANAMTLAYGLKLGLQARRTNIRAQKIDSSTLEIFKMVLASFYVKDKLESARFV